MCLFCSVIFYRMCMFSHRECFVFTQDAAGHSYAIVLFLGYEQANRGSAQVPDFENKRRRHQLRFWRMSNDQQTILTRVRKYMSLDSTLCEIAHDFDPVQGFSGLPCACERALVDVNSTPCG